MVVEEHLSEMTSIVGDLQGLLTPVKHPRGHPGSLRVYGKKLH